MMPRVGRVVLPDYPHHIVQRGHNRQVVFAQEEDFMNYLGNLHDLKVQYGIQVFAYCLMTNHVHLLLQPGEAIADLGMLMKALAVIKNGDRFIFPATFHVQPLDTNNEASLLHF